MGVAELVEDWGICIWLVLRRTVLLEWEAGEQPLGSWIFFPRAECGLTTFILKIQQLEADVTRQKFSTPA